MPGGLNLEWFSPCFSTLVTVSDVFRVLRCILDENFTPRQVATALQVSESSVKRWCDRGVIRTDRTVGGHRRIPLEFLLEFLETTNRHVVQPGAIGLDQPHEKDRINDPGALNRESLQARFETALIAGDESTCRKILSAWYALHGGIANVSDELLSPTFRSIGEKWTNGKIEIYEERRACDICYRLLHELRRLLPETQGFAPLAMGGTASGDGTQLPSQVIEIVFREYGWRTIGLGSNIPFSSMLSAARRHMPKIFWLSTTHIENTEVFLNEYAQFAKSLPKGIMLLVGGRALNDEIRQKMVFSAHCDTMVQLSTLAKTLRIGSRPLDPPI